MPCMTVEAMADIDLPAYFDRIGYTGPDGADARDVLHCTGRRAQPSHPVREPRPADGCAGRRPRPAALSDKLVGRRRGGYCYEQNGLMATCSRRWATASSGSRARGLDERPAVRCPRMTHQVLAVTVPGVDGRFLVDVGFGGQTLSSPIRLEAGPVQQTRHEPYRHRRPRRRHHAGGSGPRHLASRSTCSPPGRNRASISRSEVGMCQRIPTRSSSPG